LTSTERISEKGLASPAIKTVEVASKDKSSNRHSIQNLDEPNRKMLITKDDN
jgi:hypothetical protein